MSEDLLSIYFACLFVVYQFFCLFVYPINVKTAEPILFKTSHEPREGLWMLRISKLASKKIAVCKFLKIHQKILLNLETYLFLFYIVQREDSHR